MKRVWQSAFSTIPFILDWAHAMEHVHACAGASYSAESQRKTVRLSKKKGDPPPGAAETDARLILKRNAASFRENAPQMDYPTDRKKGWPTGSGIVESCVKQVGKRVKGTERFWPITGAESTLALLSYFFSEDGRWNRFWNQDIIKLQSAA